MKLGTINKHYFTVCQTSINTHQLFVNVLNERQAISEWCQPEIGQLPLQCKMLIKNYDI